jgi:hypothetical protein
MQALSLQTSSGRRLRTALTTSDSEDQCAVKSRSDGIQTLTVRNGREAGSHKDLASGGTVRLA